MDDRYDAIDSLHSQLRDTVVSGAERIVQSLMHSAHGELAKKTRAEWQSLLEMPSIQPLCACAKGTTACLTAECIQRKDDRVAASVRHRIAAPPSCLLRRSV